jgi:hypothetical protein
MTLHPLPLTTAVETGFVWTVEQVRAGQVIATDCGHNLVPTEGLNDMLAAYYKGAAQTAAWYIGLYEGNYTPNAAVTAASIAAAATETTAYDETARPAWVAGTVATGAVSNIDNKATFTFNAPVTVYGGFLVSTATKGGALGVLASVIRFPSPKAMEAGDTLRITAGTTLISA